MDEREYDPWAKSSFSPSNKAEENQKIVDALFHFVKEETKQANYVTMKGDPISEECFKEAQEEITIAINTIKTIIERATGRPIQEILSTNKDAQEVGKK